jgi:Flp pilus assembly protein TadG
MIRALLRDRRGGVAVEIALLLPTLMLALLGTMEFGRMAWTQAALTYAVQETARCASVRPTLCGTAALAQTFAAQRVAALGIQASAFTVTNPACGWQVRGEVTHGFILYALVPTAPKIAAQVCRP